MFLGCSCLVPSRPPGSSRSWRGPPGNRSLGRPPVARHKIQRRKSCQGYRGIEEFQGRRQGVFGVDESHAKKILAAAPCREFLPASINQNQIRVSDLARDAATKDSAEVLRPLGTSPAGLTEEEAAARLEQYGPNEVAARSTKTGCSGFTLRRATRW